MTFMKNKKAPFTMTNITCEDNLQNLNCVITIFWILFWTAQIFQSCTGYSFYYLLVCILTYLRMNYYERKLSLFIDSENSKELFLLFRTIISIFILPLHVQIVMRCFKVMLQIIIPFFSVSLECLWTFQMMKLADNKTY